MSRKRQLFANQKPFIRTNRSLFPPKTTLFHPPPPIATSLNLLSTKEYSCSFNLRSKSLRCKAGTSHRFKSLPAIPGKVVIPGIAGYLMNAGCFSQQSRIDRRFESSPGSREGRSPSGTFGSFRTSEKNKIVSLQEVSRFSKPRFTAHRQQLRTNKLKSFCRFAAVSLPGRHTSCAFLPLRGFLRRLRRLLSAALPPFGCLRQPAACANKRKNPSDICLRDFW